MAIPGEASPELSGGVEKHMKKFITILMTVAIAGIFVAGCSSSDNAGDNAPENKPVDNAAPTG